MAEDKTWLVVIIIAFLAFLYLRDNPQALQNIQSILNGTSMNTYNYYYQQPAPTIIIHSTNLCNLAAVYFPDAGCAAVGGVFTCTANEVSCLNAALPIDCGTAAMAAGQAQCAATGALFHCDAANLWCRYG